MLKWLFMPIEAPLFSNYYLYLCGDIYDSPMIKKSIFTILILFLLLLSQTASGQKLRASLSHYSTDNGLTSNTIADIIQDGYGYLWIATWNGLSRFDGYQFYNYRTGNASMIPGLHNRIRSLVADKSQNIWMRMYDGRVFVLNRLADCIVDPFAGDANGDRLRTDNHLFLTNNGEVMAEFDDKGIYMMRLDSSKFSQKVIATEGLEIHGMAEGFHDDIWVATNKGLRRLDLTVRRIEDSGYFEQENVTAVFSNGHNVYAGCHNGAIYKYVYGKGPQLLRAATGQSIIEIFVDSKGLVWFADTRYGVTRLLPDGSNEKHFEQYVPVPEHDDSGGGFSEQEGVVWTRMNHGGFGYYNRQTDEIEYFHNDPTNPWNLSNTVNASIELPEGVVFLSTTRRGLDKLEILKDNIKRSQLVPGSSKPEDNEVRGLYYDKKRKWLMMGNKSGMLVITKQDGSRSVVTHDSKGNPIGRIYGISGDSKDNIWISSKDYGVFKMSVDNGGYHIVNYCHKDGDKYSLSSNAAYQTAEDSDGNIWVATYGGGVNLLTYDKAGNAKFIHTGNEMQPFPNDEYMKARTIARTSEGKIWLGTTDGLLELTYRNQKLNVRCIENSRLQPGQILMSTDIVYLATDNVGTMWVGTNGGGLARTIGKDEEGAWLFESFGTANGLPSEELKSITFDLENNVWFATDHILCTYNASKKFFNSFSSLDGVDETICSEGSALTLPSGTILFGTLEGYYTIDRKRLSAQNASMLKLRITDFLIDGKVVSPRNNPNFDYYVPDAEQVTLRRYENNFAFRFSAMNYQLQHRIHYQYMLEGYDDKEWHNADNTRMASYEGLPTGTYHFKVKAFLLESPDKYDMRTIEVVVLPHFLLSSHAIWGYMLLLFILAVGLMFSRQKKIREKGRYRVLQLGSGGTAYLNQEDYDFVKAQLDWLEVNHSNPSLKIDEMVAQSNLNRESYKMRLKELTGMTPKEFVNDFRHRKAVMYIESTDMPIADIAAKTGFDSSISFISAFKQTTGLTPSKYRDQQRQQNAEKQKNEEEDKNNKE